MAHTARKRKREGKGFFVNFSCYLHNLKEARKKSLLKERRKRIGLSAKPKLDESPEPAPKPESKVRVFRLAV